MKTQKLKGALALGSLTAAVALLAGLGTAQAAGAPGAGSFPQSFLIPGTNTSISIYGSVQTRLNSEWGSVHVNDTGPSNVAGASPGIIAQLPLEGPGTALSATSANSQEHAMHGGLRWASKYTNIFFETRTPSDLGEIKTVVMMNFAFLNNQGSYTGSPTVGGASNNAPSSGIGNNEVARLQWAYGTLGPWLIGQTNSAWSDPLMFNSDISDQNQVGPMQTANIRRPQIRYTYLAGNGVTLSASLEADSYVNSFGTTTKVTTAFAQDSTGINGYTNYPSFNAGIGWEQPWGHVMARVGVAEDEFHPSALSAVGAAYNLKKTGWAAETGVMLNTWGQDQWRALAVYDDGAPTYLSDMGSGAFVNTATSHMELIREFAVNTSYVHRFSPNWRATAEVGMGFFSNPDSAVSDTASATFNAPQASFEKRHLESALSATYSPVPGRMDISLEWDHWERWTQASGTNGHTNIYNLWFKFFW